MNDSWKFGLRQHWFKRKCVFFFSNNTKVTAFFRFHVLNIFIRFLSEFFFFILSKITSEPIISHVYFVFLCVFVFYLKTPSVIKLWHWMIGWLANTELPRMLHEVFGTKWGIIPCICGDTKATEALSEDSFFPSHD